MSRLTGGDQPASAPGTLLSGKVALVTGGGSGVGRAMARLFARNGCAVMVVDVVPERVDQVVGEVRGEGGRASGEVEDISQDDGAGRMVGRTLEEFGRIDILCNNAGIMDGAMPVADTTDELWEKVMAVNVGAPFRASRKAIPVMLKQRGGVIINTASVAGLFGGVAGAPYTVSKHALLGLTRSIAAHYGGRGIRCNAMVLGGVNTNIGMGGAQPSKEGLEHLMKAASMMPRTADPTEIAELALFLASGKSSYINGSAVVIDGGWTVL